MQAAPLISVVITTYNRSDALCAVLGGLQLQSDRDFEIVVADDGSAPEHRSKVQSALAQCGLPAVHMWHPDEGFRAACARNRGVAVARGQYIILMDGDCVPELDFVAQHRQLSEKDCFINGSRVLLSAELTVSAIAAEQCLTGRSAAFWLGQALSGHANKWFPRLRLPDFTRRKHPDFIWKGIRSCNMSLWRSDYEKINGFDESFVGWGHEDADFVLRLHNAGLIRKNGFAATEVYHLWHTEAARAAESVNATRVRERLNTGQILPTIGYRDSKDGAEMVVSRWG
jgi:GT2 family glycosyltransferase